MTKTWGSEVEIERKKRIKAAVAAYAYEHRNESIMSDSDFDDLCYSIDPTIMTGDEVLDKFFKEVFQPHTGQWIWKYPKSKLNKLYQLYETFYRKK
jgi:hypothetical protein